MKVHVMKEAPGIAKRAAPTMKAPSACYVRTTWPAWTALQESRWTMGGGTEGSLEGATGG